MRKILKGMVLYGLYLKARWKYRKQIQFNGYCVFYAHAGSAINIAPEGG